MTIGELHVLHTNVDYAQCDVRFVAYKARYQR
jgi:hypothetical protein